MSVFGNILEKLGLRKSSKASRPPTTQQRKPQQSAPQGGSAGAGSASQASQVPGTAGTSRTTGSSSSGATTGAPQQPVAMVDVTAHLEELAVKNRQQLNWRTSIVDLLKLLDIDSGPAARKELADELGAPAELKDGSAELTCGCTGRCCGRSPRTAATCRRSYSTEYGQSPPEEASTARILSSDLSGIPVSAAGWGTSVAAAR